LLGTLIPIPIAKSLSIHEEPAMLGENHDLFHELPEYVNRINQLKVSNGSFAKLFEEYHQVNSEVERIEENNEGHSDAYVLDLKKRRLHLKDALYTMLRG
jgi:uncharacterized protein YdcH (DUF465 family)